MLVSTLAGSIPHASASRRACAWSSARPLHVVVERVQAGRGRTPGLPPAAAQPLAPHPGGRDHLGRAEDEAADRGAEPLGQADRDHVATAP
jgi:hypothetical protein